MGVRISRQIFTDTEKTATKDTFKGQRSRSQTRLVMRILLNSRDVKSSLGLHSSLDVIFKLNSKNIFFFLCVCIKILTNN